MKFIVNKHNRQTVFLNLLSELDPDQTWEVVIRKPKSKRSIDQNKYYWEMLTQMAVYFGYIDMNGRGDSSMMHKLMTYKFLSEEGKFKDESFLKIKSTQDLNVKDFSTYVEDVTNWAKQYGFTFTEEDYLDQEE